MKDQPVPDGQDSGPRVTWRAFLIGLACIAVFTWLIIWREHRPPNRGLSSTQVPVLPYIILMAGVLLLNPLLRLARVVRAFSAGELMVIFVMGVVASGIPTFGLVSQVLPAIGSLYNPSWNNAQSRWDILVQPYLDERFYVAADGAQAAAVRLRDAETAYRREEAAWRRAEGVLAGRADVPRLERELAALAANATATPGQLRQAERALATAREALRRQELLWTDVAAGRAPEVVARDGAALAAARKATWEQAQQEMRAHETTAFELIRTFRVGLPPDQRAVPGFIYESGEGLGAYSDRVRRLFGGRAALADLSAAEAALRATPPETMAAMARVDAALVRLAPLADGTALAAEQQTLLAQDAALKQELRTADTAARALADRRRFAAADDFPALDRQFSELAAQRAALNSRVGALRTELERVQQRLAPIERVAAVATRLRAWQEQWRAAAADQQPALLDDLRVQMAGFAALDASFARFLVGDIPWGVWLRPLTAWAVVVLLTYLVLLTLNILIFRQWAHHEMLIYPLAELPLTLAGTDCERRIPAVFRSGLFWTGFAVAAVVLGWNQLVANGYLPGADPIRLRRAWGPFVEGTFLSALTYNFQFEIFFTLIGISFLIPAQVSYSLWLFYVLYAVELIIMCKLGFGTTEYDFPGHWAANLNFRFAQGGGALLVFAAVVLWKCRKYLLAALRPASVAQLDRDEQLELRLSSALFLGGSVVLIAALTWGMGANLFYVIFFYIIILVITIGLVRAVAEGGVMMVRPFFSPFHLIRSGPGMDKWWSSPTLFAPLVIFYSVLFMDIKTFIAPSMADSLKIRSVLKLERRRFYGALAAAIILAMVFAVVVQLIFAYSRGADNMNMWFYTHLPRTHMFGRIAELIKTQPVDTQRHLWWLLGGGLAMVLLLYGRQHLMWLPHPIGMLMLVNPHMSIYWGSILIGWLCKTLVTRYGNQQTYPRVRCFFIGLIAGELVLCLFGATLNR